MDWDAPSATTDTSLSMENASAMEHQSRQLQGQQDLTFRLLRQQKSHSQQQQCIHHSRRRQRPQAMMQTKRSQRLLKTRAIAAIIAEAMHLQRISQRRPDLSLASLLHALLSLQQLSSSLFFSSVEIQLVQLLLKLMTYLEKWQMKLMVNTSENNVIEDPFINDFEEGRI